MAAFRLFKSGAGNWNVAGNWNTGEPVAGDSAIFSNDLSIATVTASTAHLAAVKITAGTLRIQSGTLETDRLNQSGTGKVVFTGNGTLQIDLNISSSMVVIDFGTKAAHGTLVWNGASRTTLNRDVTLQNFFSGDALKISTTTGTFAFAYFGTGTDGVVSITKDSRAFASVHVYDPTGGLSQQAFSLNASTGYIELDNSVACFLHGTRIATLRGEVAVEDLRIGDLLVTAGGGAQPIRWIGTRSYVTKLVPAASRAALMPIRIAAGALGDALPVRDLFVSPEHMMCLDDVLVPAGKLVNGTTIAQVGTPDVVRYFHLELPRHAVIHAEGAPTESYLDTGNRNMFANVLSYLALGHVAGAARPAPCLPIVTDGAALEAVRAGLASGAPRAHETMRRSA